MSMETSKAKQLGEIIVVAFDHAARRANGPERRAQLAALEVSQIIASGKNRRVGKLLRGVALQIA